MLKRISLVLALVLSPAVASAQQAGPYFRLRLQSSGFTPPTGYLNVYAKSSNKHLYIRDSAGNETDITGNTAVGTVTSVGMSVPSFLSVAGSPVTSSGTLAVTLGTQAANRVFAGPSTGADAAPTFRALVAADLPNTAVSAGTCTACDLTIDAQGRITAKASGAGGSTGNYTFSTNTMDLSGAATMSIGTTNATAIALGQNTSLAAGKTLTSPHYAGSGSAPSCAPGAALGSGSPTCSCTGTDTAMTCTFTSDSGTTTGVLGTVTFAATFGTQPYCVSVSASQANAASIGWSSAIEQSAGSATTFVLRTGTAPAGGTSYPFNIICMK